MKICIPVQAKSPGQRLLTSLVALSMVGCSAHGSTDPAQPSVASQPIEVAITFDDLPGSGALAEEMTRVSVHQRILRALEKHHVPPTTGFANGKNIERSEHDRAAFALWLSSGQRVGSHTYNHEDLVEVGADAFNADIDRNDAELARLTQGRGGYKTFRYPYLKQGRDLETRRKVRAHLAERGYRVAEVTIDFGDWAFIDPYVRCMQQHDGPAAQALKESFVANARTFLLWSHETARVLFGRPIKHVLLLHDGLIEAETMDALLTAYEQLGVRFITLDEALSDPVYRNPPEVVTSPGDTYLEQVIHATGITPPPYPLQPLKLLEVICPASMEVASARSAASPEVKKAH